MDTPVLECQLVCITIDIILGLFTVCKLCFGNILNKYLFESTTVPHCYEWSLISIKMNLRDNILILASNDILKWLNTIQISLITAQLPRKML